MVIRGEHRAWEVWKDEGATSGEQYACPGNQGEYVKLRRYVRDRSFHFPPFLLACKMTGIWESVAMGLSAEGTGGNWWVNGNFKGADGNPSVSVTCRLHLYVKEPNADRMHTYMTVSRRWNKSFEKRRLYSQNIILFPFYRWLTSFLVTPSTQLLDCLKHVPFTFNLLMLDTRICSILFKFLA